MARKGAQIYLPSTQEVVQFEGDNLEAFTEIDDYWMNREGLVFYPFNRNDKAYFFSKGDNQNVAREFSFIPNDKVTKEEYTTSILIAQDEMNNGALEKVVLARNKQIQGKFNPEDVFESAITQFPNSYGLYAHLEGETWVGASPELLLEFKNGSISTVALAGTKLLTEAFTEKEQEEQGMVEEFVESKLIEVGLTGYIKSEKEEAAFGNIKHLRTTYACKASNEQALELLKHLQPTSAVCGLPRDISFSFLQEFETMNRGFYSGITGLLKKDSAIFFVNLRCMRFLENTVELYAGAGITANSNAEAEWEETERKIGTFEGLLNME